MNKLLFSLIALAFLASCTLFDGDAPDPTAPSAQDIAAFQTSFMSSYYAERTGAPAGTAGGPRALTPFSVEIKSSGSKATVPIGNFPATTGLLFANLASATSLSNYPEPGQTTSFTATLLTTETYPLSGLKVYRVVSTTAFPASDIRASYVEEYYVQDVGLNAEVTPWNTGTTSLGTWTSADPIVKKDAGGNWSLDPVDGANGYLLEDRSARLNMLLTFRDGSTRTETIVSSSLSDGPKFDPTAFDIDDSLDLSQAFVPAVAAAPTATSEVMFSSVVKYFVTPATNYNFWFWLGADQQTILGVRYYTEVANPSASTYTAYTASFEKTLGTLTTTADSFPSTMTSIFSGSVHDTLAETVLRQEVVYGLGTTTGNSPDYYIPTGTGAITTNMQTRVVNIAGKKDFYLSQMNADNVSLSSLGSTIYIPTGDATEILAGDSSLAVFTREQQILPAAGTLPFAVLTTNIPFAGDLGTLYSSIVTTTFTSSIPNTPPATELMPANSELVFNGQQAVGLTTTSALDLSLAGSVEAWVYINKMTDTAGIVHNGVAVDFSDEGYSLQGWGSSGQIAIILNPEGGGAYDSVLSKNNLAKQKWYYIVATWDTSASPSNKRINLYVNGALSASGAMTNTAGPGVRQTTQQIVVGSQLPSIYSTAYGYFGLDGKIVGANIRGTAMNAATVLANYNAYKNNTASW